MSNKHKGQTLTIQDKQYPVVYSFPIMYLGWASDNVGYVVLDGDKHRMATTNHGTPCFMRDKDIDAIQEELEDAQTGLTAALALCKNA